MTRLRRPSRQHERSMFKAMRNAAARKQKYLCYWCGKRMQTGVATNHADFLTGDHLVPLHAGGMTKPGNIVAACRACNNGRHPELNRTHKRRKLTIGTETRYSPFDVLKK